CLRHVLIPSAREGEGGAGAALHHQAYKKRSRGGGGAERGGQNAVPQHFWRVTIMRPRSSFGALRDFHPVYALSQKRRRWLGKCGPPCPLYTQERTSQRASPKVRFVPIATECSAAKFALIRSSRRRGRAASVAGRARAPWRS